MQRLEQRLNEMNQRQQQILNRMESLQGAMPGAGRGNMPPPGAPMGARGGGPGFRPMPAQGFEGVQPPPAQEWPNGALTVRINRLGDMVRLCFLGFVICNILSAIWIFSDIRKRGEGPGIFVALALLAGIPAAIIYSLVRLGDRITVAAK
jgi:hypothetical protein